MRLKENYSTIKEMILEPWIDFFSAALVTILIPHNMDSRYKRSIGLHSLLKFSMGHEAFLTWA